VPNFEQPKCFINASAQGLVHDKMQYLETIANADFEILKEYFQDVFDQFKPDTKQHERKVCRLLSRAHPLQLF